MPRSVYSPKKLKELIVYLCEIGANDERLGALKLNKLLYFADKEAYLRLGQTITGARYQHLEEGPAPRALRPVRRELLEEGRLEPDPRPVGTHVLHRFTVRGHADLSLFSPEEREIVHQIVRRYWFLSGTDLSILSHNEWGYLLTDMGDDIPPRMSWLSPEELSPEQVEYGQTLWKTLHGSAV